MTINLSTAPLLSIAGLRKAYGGVEAVRDVSFDVRPGQLVALIGANGAGKTTTFNCINGQVRPNGGRVHFNPAALSTAERIALEKEGELSTVPTNKITDITGRPPRRIVKLGIGRTFQITATFSSMTVIENVQMVMIAKRKKWRHLWGRAGTLFRAEALALLNLVGIGAEAERHAAILAYGDLKRLELAMALAESPRLLLMDEPTAGMGGEERDALMALTRKIATEQQIGVLFTEHDMDAVFNYADWIIVMHRGAVIARGIPAAIKANAAVRAAYLGEEITHA